MRKSCALTRPYGLKQKVFCGEETRLEDLLNRPVFIDLRRMDDPIARRLLMGSLVRRLYGIREYQGTRRAQLEHLLVLEEAHHVFRRAEGTGLGSEMLRTSNQLLADAFAEIRAYGQAIMVIDQSPTLLDAAVLRNTNIKLAHRLLYADDCRAVGDAMGLNDEEQVELRRLPRGHCVVHGPGMVRPVQVDVKRWELS